VDVPALVGYGPLTAGSSNGVELRGAAAGKPCILVVGFSALNLPHAAGVLVPSPDVMLHVTTDALGRFALPFTWPAGVPSGVGLWFQAWVLDAGADSGHASSNACKGISS